MADQHLPANNARDTECKIPITEDEDEDHHQYFDGRQIHRVSKLVRFSKHNEEDYYAPKMVSFSPYYHGLPELGMAEEFKHKVLARFVSSSGKDKQFFYYKIFKVIDQIRNCYVGVSGDAYGDGALAEMILLDASFAIYLMKIVVGDTNSYLHFCRHLGMALLKFAIKDLFLLDNQIPLWVIELLTNLIYGNKEDGPVFTQKFSKFSVLSQSMLISISGEFREQPLHVVGACHQLLVEEPDNAGKNPSSYCLKNIKFKSRRQWWPWKKGKPHDDGIYNHQSRSVSDLKAKGIHFKPSSYCLKDIKFKSYTFYGQLQLPICLLSTSSQQFLTQMIAYEASPETDVGITIICYVNFLKSLVVKSEDVKVLREKKILFSTLDSDEQVVEVIKGIDTLGLEYDFIFDDVKMKIEEHCSSKAKTWIAELIHTYFRNPWTFMALLASTFLLCLTFLQTYYTMNPLK